jgi:hypothetical protein
MGGDGGACLGECLRGRKPDAGARASDKGDLGFENDE